MKWLALLLFILTFQNTSFAQENSACPTVSLDQNDQAISDIPTWDQDQLGACYSYSASYLATVWIRKEWSKTLPSLKRITDNPLLTFQRMQRSIVFEKILDASRGRTCMATLYILSQYKKDLGATGRNLAVPKCSTFGLIESENDRILENPKDIKNRMHQLLQMKSARPFAIEYCFDAFMGRRDKDNRPLSYIKKRTFKKDLNYINDDEKMTENFSPRCGLHASAVTGQKMENGKCYFRVRNTWGPTVQYYKEAPDLIYKQDSGYLWIGAQDLAINTLRVISLKK